jgi:hypothetical protein
VSDDFRNYSLATDLAGVASDGALGPPGRRPKPSGAATLIALLLAIASEGLDYYDEYQDRRWARFVARLNAMVRQQPK